MSEEAGYHKLFQTHFVALGLLALAFCNEITSSWCGRLRRVWREWPSIIVGGCKSDGSLTISRNLEGNFSISSKVTSVWVSQKELCISVILTFWTYFSCFGFLGKFKLGTTLSFFFFPLHHRTPLYLSHTVELKTLRSTRRGQSGPNTTLPSSDIQNFREVHASLPKTACPGP